MHFVILVDVEIVFVVVAVLLSSVTSAISAKILLVPIQFKSHVLTQLLIGEELAQRGHEVSIAIGSRFPKQKETIEQLGIRTISFHVPDDFNYPVSDEFERKLVEYIFDESDVKIKFRLESDMSSKMGLRLCELMMEDTAFVDDVRRLKFDLAIVDQLLVCPCNAILPHHLAIPFVSQSIGFFPWHVRLRPCRRRRRCSRTATGCHFSNGSQIPSASSC